MNPLSDNMLKVSGRWKDTGPFLDSEAVVGGCIVAAIHSFSLIQRIQFTNNRKPLTVAKREAVAGHLTDILKYCGVAADTLGLSLDDFDVDLISEQTEDLPDVVQQDSILSSTAGIQSLTFILEDLFVNSDKETLSERVDELEEDDALTELFAQVIQQCILLTSITDLDFGVVVDNMLVMPEGIKLL